MALIDFDVDLIFLDLDGSVGGDQDWPLRGFVDRRLTTADFADAHGNSSADAAECGFASFGNERTGVEGEYAIPLRELPELVFGDWEWEERMNYGVDYIAQKTRGFDAGFPGDYQDGGGDIGEKRHGQPVGKRVGIYFREAH